MKRIGIYFFCVVAIGCVTSSILYRKSEEANEIRLEKAAQEETAKTAEPELIPQTQEKEMDAIDVSDSNVDDERFFVIEEEGYLAVYDRLTMKRYDETTIQVQDLPERLREKVKEGLYFMNEEELYAFLENYSS